MRLAPTRKGTRLRDRPVSTWRVYRDPRILRMLVLGFAAGLPLLLIYGTLSFRLREAGVDRATIGFLSWVALVYALKWTWAPFVDRFDIPVLGARLGHRRAWLLAAQCAVAAGLVCMGRLDARTQLPMLAASALFTAFAGATQDISLDAYRIESAPMELQGALAAAYQIGYRIGMIWAGAGALWLAAGAAPTGGYHPGAWTTAYCVMAASMLAGMLAVLATPYHAKPAPRQDEPAPHGILAPFADLAHRYRRHVFALLGLVATYRLANIVMGVMANPFYHDIGFTKDQVAAVSKVYGLAMAVLGGIVGGAMTARHGIARMMWIAAFFSSASIVLYAWLATRGADLTVLVLAVSTDNFAEGIAGTVFIAFLSALTRSGYSATQYAALSSLTLLLPKFIAGFSGVAVDALGYPTFFVACAASGVVALGFLWRVARVSPAVLPGSGA